MKSFDYQAFNSFLEDNLTRQELIVLKLATTDLSHKQIAEHLNVSETTVKKHYQHIAQKCEIKDPKAMRRFLRRVEKIWGSLPA